MRKLVLFDIDGTLIDSGDAGPRALMVALEEVFDRPVALDGYSMSGKTDTQIALELMERNGVDREETRAALPRVWDLYADGLARNIQERDPEIFTGVFDLLNTLSDRHDEALLGLLTGNVERGARIKMERVGMRSFFRMGAFGDRAEERKALPQIAVDAAARLVQQHYAGKDIVIIGDTPNDVLCGKHLGVRSVAVATGSYGRGDLLPHDPDFFFEDFAETAQVAEAILAP